MNDEKLTDKRLELIRESGAVPHLLDEIKDQIDMKLGLISVARTWEEVLLLQGGVAVMRDIYTWLDEQKEEDDEQG